MNRTTRRTIIASSIAIFLLAAGWAVGATTTPSSVKAHDVGGAQLQRDTFAVTGKGCTIAAGMPEGAAPSGPSGLACTGRVDGVDLTAPASVSNGYVTFTANASITRGDVAQLRLSYTLDGKVKVVRPSYRYRGGTSGSWPVAVAGTWRIPNVPAGAKLTLNPEVYVNDSAPWDYTAGGTILDGIISIEFSSIAPA